MKSATSDDQDNLKLPFQSSVPLNSFSQQVTSKSSKMIFKIFYEGDCKRVTIDYPFTFNDLILKSAKNFGLGQGLKYVLVSDEQGSKQIVNNQEQLSMYLVRQQQKGPGIVKFTLAKDESNERSTGPSEVEEGGQHSEISQVSSIQHTVHPLMIMKILKRLNEKGCITKHDVKVLNLQNSSLNHKQLAFLNDRESLNILQQCEGLVSEIVQSPSQNQAIKSDGELGASQQVNALFSSNRSDLLHSAIDQESRINRLRNRESLPSLKEFMKRNKNQQNRRSFHTDSQKLGFLSGRARTNSGVFDTPGNPFPRSTFQVQKQLSSQQLVDDIFEPADQQQQLPVKVITQEQEEQGVNQSSEVKVQKGLFNQYKVVKDEEDDEVSIISDANINNNTILERNESLEISLALNESQINQSYMK